MSFLTNATKLAPEAFAEFFAFPWMTGERKANAKLQEVSQLESRNAAQWAKDNYATLLPLIAIGALGYGVHKHQQKQEEMEKTALAGLGTASYVVADALASLVSAAAYSKATAKKSKALAQKKIKEFAKSDFGQYLKRNSVPLSVALAASVPVGYLGGKAVGHTSKNIGDFLTEKPLQEIDDKNLDKESLDKEALEKEALATAAVVAGLTTLLSMGLLGNELYQTNKIKQSAKKISEQAKDIKIPSFFEDKRTRNIVLPALGLSSLYGLHKFKAKDKDEQDSKR